MTMPADTSTFDMSNPVDQDEAFRILRAWVLLRRGAGAARLREYLFGHDEPLEQGQMDTLDVLIRSDRTMRVLAEKLRIEPSSATRAMQRLAKNGLAERFTSPDDGRIVMVRITEEGRRRHAEVSARRTTALTKVVETFGDGERAQLADLLERLVIAIDEVVDDLA